MVHVQRNTWLTWFVCTLGQYLLMNFASGGIHSNHKLNLSSIKLGPYSHCTHLYSIFIRWFESNIVLCEEDALIVVDEYSITDGYGETQVKLHEKWRIGISTTTRENLPKSGLCKVSMPYNQPLLGYKEHMYRTCSNYTRGQWQHYTITTL